MIGRTKTVLDQYHETFSVYKQKMEQKMGEKNQEIERLLEKVRFYESQFGRSG